MNVQKPQSCRYVNHHRCQDFMLCSCMFLVIYDRHTCVQNTFWCLLFWSLSYQKTLCVCMYHSFICIYLQMNDLDMLCGKCLSDSFSPCEESLGTSSHCWVCVWPWKQRNDCSLKDLLSEIMRLANRNAPSSIAWIDACKDLGFFQQFTINAVDKVPCRKVARPQLMREMRNRSHFL